MITLVVNPGSTSIKYKLFDSLEEKLFCQFDFKGEGEYTLKVAEQKYNISSDDYNNSLKWLKDQLKNVQIDKIGVRVVHGGERFREPTKIDKSVIDELKQLNDLAPLHNPPAVTMLENLLNEFPDTEITAIFDTEFYKDFKEQAYLYALPYDYYNDYKIRRYGFHGISHNFINEVINIKLQEINPTVEQSRIISCHLGGGASITASIDGKAIDTSMGFTPNEGLIMATRTGDIDSGAIMYLSDKLAMSNNQINELLNKKSGLLGLSGKTKDMKTLVDDYKTNEEGAVRAIDNYVYRVKKYIGSYFAVLGGLDALVFAGGVGEGSDFIRKKVCEGLDHLGISLDDLANSKANYPKVPALVSSAGSKVKIFVVTTNEELMIAKQLNN